MKQILFSIRLFIYNVLYFLGRAWAFVTRKGKKVYYKIAPIKTSRRKRRENYRHINDVVFSSLIKTANSAMKDKKMVSDPGRKRGKSLIIAALALLFIGLQIGCKQDAVDPTPQASTLVVANPLDTMVKFTLYSKRVPYIWKREINGAWVQDTVKTNSVVKYEIFDKANYNSGVGYWATMNLAGISTDSLHIIGEYKGRMTQMASLKGQSAAYVVLSAIGPK